MQQKIPIENLYYLLCYAWGVSDQLDWVKVNGEKCHSLENLLSINRVIFSTLKRLMRIEGIDADIRVRLRKTLARFPHIEEIRVTEGLLGRLLQHRFSGVYSLVLNICR